MGIARNVTETVEELRLPAGGSFIITDEIGAELFRVTADGDAVKVAGIALDGAALAGAASGTAVDHIDDPTGAATDQDDEARAAIASIIDALETFGIAAAS